MTGFFSFQGLRIFSEERGDGDDDFAVTVRINIQHPDGETREAFQVVVISPKYLDWRLGEGQEEYLYGKGMFITAQWDVNLLSTEMQALVENNEAQNWDDLRRVVERDFEWIG